MRWNRIFFVDEILNTDFFRLLVIQRNQPEEYQERLSAFQTLAGVESIADAGHNIHHDQPAALAQLTEQFLLDR